MENINEVMKLHMRARKEVGDPIPIETAVEDVESAVL